MRISFCAVTLALQSVLAIGALALGYPSVSGAFGVFALVQVISLAAQRCAPDGTCDTRLVSPDVPRPVPDARDAGIGLSVRYRQSLKQG